MDLEQRVLEIVAAVLNRDVACISSPEVRGSLELAGMDSINAIQVMVVLEEEYGIAFGEEDMVEENFFHAGKITDLLRRQLDEANRAAEGSL